MSARSRLFKGNSEKRCAVDVNEGVESTQVAIKALGVDDVVEGSEEKKDFELLGTSTFHRLVEDDVKETEKEWMEK